jgi:hypothetical protein
MCGLAGGRLQETILADIIRRAARRAGIEKNVTAHTLRHTAATWLRQELGDTRLVAEYLGHADLSTVARYAHVDRDELFVAAGRLEHLAAPGSNERAPGNSNRTTASSRVSLLLQTAGCDVRPASQRDRAVVDPGAGAGVGAADPPASAESYAGGTPCWTPAQADLAEDRGG